MLRTMGILFMPGPLEMSMDNLPSALRVCKPYTKPQEAVCDADREFGGRRSDR
jgi:hypothetical protein